MPPSSTVAAAGHATDVEILSVDWRRIQVVVRLRPAPGAALDPSTLGLRQAELPDVVMPATRVVAENGTIVARFNVMQGPGQMPLDPGSWVLAGGPGGDAPVAPLAVTTSSPLDVAPLARSFRLKRFPYGVTPAIDPEDRTFRIDIGLNRRSTGSVPARLRAIRARVLRRLGRAHAFLVLLALVRAVWPRNGRRILFASDSRAALGGNLKIVYDRMVELGLDREYELMTLFKPSVAVRRSLADRVRLVWRVARADVIVIDDYHPVVYRINDPGTRIIQLWHAVGAFKTVGYSRAGKPGSPDPYSRAHKNYTHAIVSSEHDVEFYAEAFGIPEHRVVPTGIPRVDRFFDPAYRAAAIARTFEAFPEARARMTILFAPTFRGHGARSAHYDFDRIDYAALHAVCVDKDAVCIIRMHPFVRQALTIPERFRDRLLDGSVAGLDVNEILPSVDLLVTDYSSVVFEYSTLGRPMLFYAYDLEEYVSSRDFYEPYEQFVPGRIVRTCDDLVEAIRRDEYDLEKVAAFARRHFDHLDGHSTDRVIELILAQ